MYVQKQLELKYCLDRLLSVGVLKHPPTSTYPQWLAAVAAMGIDANTNSAVGTTICGINIMCLPCVQEYVMFFNEI